MSDPPSDGERPTDDDEQPTDETERQTDDGAGDTEEPPVPDGEQPTSADSQGISTALLAGLVVGVFFVLALVRGTVLSAAAVGALAAGVYLLWRITLAVERIADAVEGGAASADGGGK